MRREQAERSRESMLDAAADAFWRNGFKATRIQDVIDRTGMTRGAVYHHFADKRDLALVLARGEAERWPEVLGAIAESGVRGLDALHELVRTVVMRAESDVRARAVLRIGIELPDPALATVGFQQWSGFVVRALQQGIADGDVADDIELLGTAAAFVDALYGVCAAPRVPGRECSADERAERLWMLLQLGVRRRGR